MRFPIRSTVDGTQLGVIEVSANVATEIALHLRAGRHVELHGQLERGVIESFSLRHAEEIRPGAATYDPRNQPQTPPEGAAPLDSGPMGF